MRPPPHFLLALFSLSTLLAFCFAEVGEWNTEWGEFVRKDGTCKVNGRILAHKSPPAPVSPVCNDPLYTLFKFCAKQHFYVEGTSRPKKKYDDAVLYLLNGCLQCPLGNAEATVRLLNHLPSGGLFSGCSQEEVVIGSVSVNLASSRRKYGETDGTFALGGILDGRDCGIMGGSKETEFLGVVLEVKHNCGHPHRQMVLQVRMPPVIVDLIRDRGNYREWDGISLDLSMQQGWVDFGLVRPSDLRRHQAQKKPVEPQAVKIHSKVTEKEEKPRAPEPVGEAEKPRQNAAASPPDPPPAPHFVNEEEDEEGKKKREEEWGANEGRRGGVKVEEVETWEQAAQRYSLLLGVPGALIFLLCFFLLCCQPCCLRIRHCCRRGQKVFYIEEWEEAEGQWWKGDGGGGEMETAAAIGGETLEEGQQRQEGGGGMATMMA